MKVIVGIMVHFYISIRVPMHWHVCAITTCNSFSELCKWKYPGRGMSLQHFLIGSIACVCTPKAEMEIVYTSTVKPIILIVYIFQMSPV